MPYKDPTKQAAAQKRHYEANKPAYMARAKASDKKMRDAIRAWLIGYLEQHPCVDCGEAEIVVLEFDHRDGVEKVFALGDSNCRGKWRTLQAVQNEVEKCDVRCANCHRRKTALQRGHYKFSAG